MSVLVVNTGSSSIKYKVVDVASGEAMVSGLVEEVSSLEEGFEQLRHDVSDAAELAAVGHRVVHGGSRFSEPVLLDDDVESAIEECIPLAPLHNPANLAGIRLARSLFPSLPQVAVFDTAFHSTLPPRAYRYALPASVGPEVRRYGFHGTSHAYVSREAERFLGRPLRLVTLHLGNGASAAAVDRGVCVDTSMGMTPLEGLVMGTRPGDVDPGVLLHLAAQGLDLERVLNRESGLKALAGTNDVRAITARGDAEAGEALDVYCYRIRKYVGAYAAALGGLDALVFTAGVGENSPVVRARVCDGLAHLGIALDPALNEARSRTARALTAAGTPVLVVPTDEELEIARQAADLVGR